MTLEVQGLGMYVNLGLWLDDQALRYIDCGGNKKEESI